MTNNTLHIDVIGDISDWPALIIGSLCEWSLDAGQTPDEWADLIGDFSNQARSEHAAAKASANEMRTP